MRASARIGEHRMARGLTRTELEVEWLGLPKDWYSIYRWKRTVGVGYTEWLAEWIAASFEEIRLATDGLRARSFRVDDHRGQITLGTGIEQQTEKRLVRAMFNVVELPLLGRVIDYEVPLKDAQGADHGNIDLLCTQPGACLCVEAKKPMARESILKAVLQAYAYSLLVSTRRELFLNSFGLNPHLRLTPAVLSFASAQSGRQLMALSGYPRLLNLLDIMNARLAGERIAALRFFIVQNSADELKSCLTTKEGTNGDVKAVFRDGFALSIVEQRLPV